MYIKTNGASEVPTASTMEEKRMKEKVRKVKVMKVLLEVLPTVRSIADCSGIKTSVASEAPAALPVVASLFAHNPLGIENGPTTPVEIDKTYMTRNTYFLHLIYIADKGSGEGRRWVS